MVCEKAWDENCCYQTTGFQGHVLSCDGITTVLISNDNRLKVWGWVERIVCHSDHNTHFHQRLQPEIH